MTQRPLTDAEKAKLRRSHLVIIPLALVSGLVLWAINTFTLPAPAYWAGTVISILAILIYLSKMRTLERELDEGLAEVIRGTVTRKSKLGGRLGTEASGSRGKNKSASYILHINDRSFWVDAKSYGRVSEQQYVELVWLPKAQRVVQISPLD